MVLLDPSRYTEVLAITFTNDAKNEMKTRIISELTQLADNKHTSMRQAILDDFEEEKVENIEDVMTGRAKTVLSHLLHDYSRFHVSTIDHFFAQLIRHLARELNLNLGYELDIDSEKALAESVKTLFGKADDELLSWLKNYALSQIEDDKGWNIQKSISTLGKKLFQESYLDIRDQLKTGSKELATFIKKQQHILHKYRRVLQAAGQNGLDAAQKYGVEPTEFKGKSTGPFSFFRKLTESNDHIRKGPTATFLMYSESADWYNKTSDKGEQIEQVWADGLQESHTIICDFYENGGYAKYLEADAILKYIYSYGVLAALASQVIDYRTNHNILLISDTAAILNKVIEEREMPFIYEKIGSRFRYVLIDEFQDTSRHQWASLLPFLRNAVDQGGQLIVVGDVKQSVYGWRGGDMNLLLNQIEEDLQIDKTNIKNLVTNYRSVEHVVGFNNSFFTIAPELTPGTLNIPDRQPDFIKAYSEVKQNTHQTAKGYVHFQFFENNEEHKWQHYAIEQTLFWIDKCQKDGFDFSDMLILTRRNAEAREIAHNLILQNIPTISDEALSVDSSSNVKLLLSTLKFLSNEQDAVAVAEFNFYRSGNKQDNLEQLNSIPVELSALLPRRNKPLYELVEELIIYFGLNTEADIYIQRFLDICLGQVQKGNSTLNEFLDWWQEMNERNSSSELAIGLPANNNAVRVMTVHKAKGLEKPVVIIPLADSPMPPKANSIFWAKPLPDHYEKWGSLPLSFNKLLAETSFSQVYEQEVYDQGLESLNLLYVAFTRAASRLIVFANERSNAGNTGYLIKQTLSNPEFVYSNIFDEAQGLFTLGDPGLDAENTSSEESTAIIQDSAATSPLSDRIAMDDRPSKLFMAYKTEQTEKIREGILLHLALSRIQRKVEIATVLRHIQLEQTLTDEIVAMLQQKITRLFESIPEMEEWFGGTWQVINERKIYHEGHTNIPDRVMLKDNKALIIDYKREKQDQGHHTQVNRYAGLLSQIGYEIVGKYLIYIDDTQLVEVI